MLGTAGQQDLTLCNYSKKGVPSLSQVCPKERKYEAWLGTALGLAQHFRKVTLIRLHFPVPNFALLGTARPTLGTGLGRPPPTLQKHIFTQLRASASIPSTLLLTEE